MIGKCPNCGIKLKHPPYNNRETNEMLITLKYRSYKDKNLKIPSIEEIGYCDVCKASKEDIRAQSILNRKSPTTN